jgi:hypothetical protein
LKSNLQGGIKINQTTFNIGLIKVMSMSGTSSLVVGEGYFNKQTSHSKTNNGVGNAYGDQSEIHMTPYKSILHDSNTTDFPSKITKTDNNTYSLPKEFFSESK